MIRYEEESEALLHFCNSVGIGVFDALLNHVHAL